MFGLLFAISAVGGLERLVVEGSELHASLSTHSLEDGPTRHVQVDVLRGNPYIASDAAFINAIARSGSQGRLEGRGISAALYALYDGENNVGFYGLKAASDSDAERLDDTLRMVWAHNARIDLAKVHRDGRILLVVWTDGVPPDVWKAVNDQVAIRLATH
ncbi:MAG: hypothetical protein KDI75_09490 [Xanthomonadales bacterium]|nr:hypothetical protein [Xanthomonadales bacterium]